VRVAPLMKLVPNWRGFLARLIREEVVKVIRARERAGRPLGYGVRPVDRIHSTGGSARMMEGHSFPLDLSAAGASRGGGRRWRRFAA
jgi:hypothetical protein